MKNEKEKRATFTPGPWTSEDCTGGGMAGLCFAVKSENTIVARTTDGWKEAKANARLIAAAPELHAQAKILERLLDELAKQADDSRTGGWAYAQECILRLEAFGIDKEKLRAVLAKVDGGEG